MRRASRRERLILVPASPVDAARNRLAGLPLLEAMGARLTLVRDTGGIRPEVTALAVATPARRQLAAMATATLVRLERSGSTAWSTRRATVGRPWIHLRTFENPRVSLVQSLVRSPGVPQAADDASAAADLLVVELTSGEHAITFYKDVSASVPARRARAVVLYRVAGVYTSIDPDDVLPLRGEFDMVVVDDVVFVRSAARFERWFGPLDRSRVRALPAGA